jgi:hypothetical protein
LSANPVYDVSAVITWTAPTDVVTNIRIVDANMGNNPPDISDNCNGINYTITGLIANTSYSLNVFFGNASGYGPSAPISFTTTPPPDIIYSGSTSTQIEMPAGYNKLEYTICGGGGGGGAGDGDLGGGVGGQGGAQSNQETDILTVAPNTLIDIAVGLGGAGGTETGGAPGGDTMITISTTYSSLGGTGGSFAGSGIADGSPGGYNALTAGVGGDPIYAGNGGGGGGGYGEGGEGVGGIRGSQARGATNPLTEGNDTGGANWSDPYGAGGRGGDGYYYIRIYYEAPP